MIVKMNDTELKKLCINFGYNVINADTSKMMTYIDSLYKKPTIKKLTLVASTLRVNTIRRTSHEISRDIIVVIKSTISRRLKTAFKKVDIDINKIANTFDTPTEQEDNNKKIYFIIQVLYNHILPKRFPIKSPTGLEYMEYKKKLYDYIKNKNKSNKTPTDIKLDKEMEEVLQKKLCYCIKKITLKNIFLKNFLDINTKYKPYGLCINSIYKKRGLKMPKDTIGECKIKYAWYRVNNYRGLV
jgi:hypothetical protein